VDAGNEVLRRVAREEGVPLVDVAAALLGKTGSFVDFVHLAPDAHETVARLLEEAVAVEGGAR
jgi:lysophospholipase L1-like esterase